MAVEDRPGTQPAGKALGELPAEWQQAFRAVLDEADRAHRETEETRDVIARRIRGRGVVAHTTARALRAAQQIQNLRQLPDGTFSGRLAGFDVTLRSEPESSGSKPLDRDWVISIKGALGGAPLTRGKWVNIISPEIRAFARAVQRATAPKPPGA